jgi:hypothetical protein
MKINVPLCHFFLERSHILTYLSSYDVIACPLPPSPNMSSSDPTSNDSTSSSNAIPETRLLPAPPEHADDDVTTVEIGGQAITLDKLGPMVVNSDGVSPVHFFGDLKLRLTDRLFSRLRV